MVALYTAIDDMELVPASTPLEDVSERFAGPLMACAFNPNAVNADTLDSLNLPQDQADELLPKYEAACAEMPMMMARGMAEGSDTDESEPGPESPTVKGLRLPSGSTLRATNDSPDGDGGDVMEMWDVPLSYDDTERYVSTEWDFDTIGGLDRRYAGDEDGISDDGSKYRKREWVNDTAPARALLVQVYSTDDPDRSQIIIGSFIDQDGDGSV
ncbi:hypothetical protein [Mycobacterium sp. IS-1556]|uniref:hypothetical protein n=1 Tax=Mycobacterium sp. IS-1556 TaxID=1772276 RepID=UPI0007418429|nr:hypothetical protein [Mycobacterium sp. IS-1556]KUH86299.1 hypothetical protein AU187_05835 [Mycobacterium sp. IS-1556]